jgi:pyruvate formate lyase activating enzyme
MPRSLNRESLAQQAQNNAEGLVFNIQRYSIQDGPGIRTTIFLKGCPLRCAWCSNPESQNTYPEIAKRDSLCVKCGRCAAICSEKAISVDTEGRHINRELCTNCGECVGVCITGALKIFGEMLTAAEVFEEIKKDIDFYRSSGGGVTVSGGEPLFQPDFVASLFKLCQHGGINTCIETSGCGSRKSLEKVLPYTDMVLFDIKLSQPSQHRKWTGKSNADIFRNLNITVAKGIPVTLRVPLVPGVNDSDTEIKNIARIGADTLKRFGQVNILPYHRFGAGKYEMLDRDYPLTGLVTQENSEIEHIKHLFESFGLECEVVL